MPIYANYWFNAACDRCQSLIYDDDHRLIVFDSRRGAVTGLADLGLLINMEIICEACQREERMDRMIGSTTINGD